MLFVANQNTFAVASSGDLVIKPKEKNTQQKDKIIHVITLDFVEAECLKSSVDGVGAVEGQ